MRRGVFLSFANTLFVYARVACFTDSVYKRLEKNDCTFVMIAVNKELINMKDNRIDTRVCLFQYTMVQDK